MMEALLVDATMVEEGRNVEHSDLRVLREEDFQNRDIHNRHGSSSVIDAEIVRNLREASDVRNKMMWYKVALLVGVYICIIGAVLVNYYDDIQRFFVKSFLVTCVFLILVYCAVVSNLQKNADALAADRFYITGLLQAGGRTGNMTGVLESINTPSLS